MLEKTLESPLDCKEIQPVHPKGAQSWVFIGRTDVEAETPILWPPHAKSWLVADSRCWEILRAGGEGDNRGWDGWMASPTQWTWVWVDSGSWWWTRRPGVLRFMGSQRVGHDWATELIMIYPKEIFSYMSKETQQNGLPCYCNNGKCKQARLPFIEKNLIKWWFIYIMILLYSK